MENLNIQLESKIVETLKTVFDPEIPVNIYELGLIYEVTISNEGKVVIKMTLTSPNCPMAENLVQEIHDKIKAIEGVTDFMLNIVFDPPWSKNMMSEAALLELGLI
jgi:FeS assembly SUF system protein